jgi:ABC-type branched-subunit amino acid transport system permease subunit
MKANSSLRVAANIGLTFGVIILFLALTGFSSVMAGLLAGLFGVQLYTGQLPPVAGLLAFLALLGMWAGWSAARKAAGSKITAGLTAGFVVGLVLAVYSLGLGLIYGGGADLRAYLVALSPPQVNLWLSGLGPLGALVHLALFSAAGAAGGELSGLNWAGLRGRIAGWVNPLIEKARRLWAANRTLRWGLIALLAVGVLALPNLWGSYWNYVMGTVGIYVILGLGLNLIVGLSGQLVLGYAAFFAVGAYTVALLNAPVPHNLMWGFWIALPLGILFAALAGLLIGLPILRLRGDYLAIVTLGFGEIIRILLKSDVLTGFTGGPRGIQDIHPPTLFGISLGSDISFMYLIMIAVALAVFIAQRLRGSRTGRAWISMREDETVAAASGVNTFRYKLLALILGAGMAGLGGVLFAARNQFTGPDDHVLMVSINVLSIVIVGGMDSIPGIFLGAFALKGLPEILREVENYRLLAFGALLVVMMIMRPQGLWPSSRPRLTPTEETKSVTEGADEHLS